MNFKYTESQGSEVSQDIWSGLDLTGCDSDSRRGFDFSQLNSLLLWPFLKQDKNTIFNGSVTFK